MGNCNKQFLRLKLKLKTLNQIPSLLSFNGNGNLKCPSRVFVAFIPQIVDSNWIYCLVSRVLPAAPVYLVPGFFLMFQKTRLNNGLVGRIPKMSDVVKMYLAGWVPRAGLSSLGNDWCWWSFASRVAPGWGWCPLSGPQPPLPPQNAFEAVPMMSTGGRVVTGSFVCAKTKTLPLNCHFQGARQLQRWRQALIPRIWWHQAPDCNYTV